MEPYEWYQSYAGISHLLTPDILSGLHHGMDPAQPQRRMLEPFMMMTMNHSKHHHHHHNNDATATNLQQQQQQQRAQARVLNIGCGSSRLSEDMLRDGWTGGIVNVDFSNVVIDQLKAKVGGFFFVFVFACKGDNFLIFLGFTISIFALLFFSLFFCSHPTLCVSLSLCVFKYNDAYYKNNNIHIPHSELRKEEPMTFVCANVNEGLPFADGSFDLIVCKASLDAILQQQNNARHMMAECHRLLKDNATTTVTTVSTTSTTSTLLLTPTMICITHGNPESRLVHFENPRDEWWDNVGIFALANNNNNNKHVHAHQGSKYVQIYECVCVCCV